MFFKAYGDTLVLQMCSDEIARSEQTVNMQLSGTAT